MEFQTRMPAARHYIENLLAAFNLAVGTGNTEALAILTQNVAVTLQSMAAEPTDVISFLTPDYGKAIQTITNLSLTPEESCVHYTGTYQIWMIEDRKPACAALGHVQGTLEAGPQVWRWVRHSITPLP
ncbi:hypothetical protein Q9R30_15250 [Arthrobacter sp. AB6]|uniref:hypothetical protein n=1 Tax=Arthrobacter sp. AB6 TaxID=2962570 RepID=UPI002881E52C|nr:hypothetical protein [Arthrobacter sp. AB6]MDT0196712.1 hypothetical protein [Arthrobacter sp. AB6]